MIHSIDELRYHALGQTDEGRRLHISFTMRTTETQIRIISARSMSRREKSYYAKNT
ncbi:MAG: BrnT family toxin [Gammaproteobacteria bacterium]|nr:BrnT family toxin [Gammaproteobacteria bacterium]MCY4219994.1 BrnT family toxin [Gammaproteobacteria bacterium]MCY4275382.1 BrnT family toxin [Gammaproteobacteria bacterium]